MKELELQDIAHVINTGNYASAEIMIRAFIIAHPRAK